MLNVLPRSRIVFLLVFLACLALMSVALFMELAMHLEPCSLCILQRVMVIGTGIVALTAFIHGPNSRGIQIYGGLMTFTAIIGGSLSSRQIWLQHLPKDQVPSCGPGLDYLLDVFPLTDVLAMVLSGDGSCADVVWEFLGISIPGWLVLVFISLAGIGLFQILRPRA